MSAEGGGPAEILDAARRLPAAHRAGTCPACAPDGCPAEVWAAMTLFEDAVATAPSGPKTLDDVGRIADRIRGDRDGAGGRAGSTGAARNHLNRAMCRSTGRGSPVGREIETWSLFSPS